jgi:hypothetical protein
MDKRTEQTKHPDEAGTGIPRPQEQAVPARIVVTMPLAAPTTKNRKLLRCLKQHGCEVAHKKQVEYTIGEETYTGQTIITFPAGTTRRFYIRLQFSNVFTISLPTHLLLMQNCPRSWPVSFLTFSVDKRSGLPC